MFRSQAPSRQPFDRLSANEYFKKVSPQTEETIRDIGFDLFFLPVSYSFLGQNVLQHIQAMKDSLGVAKVPLLPAGDLKGKPSKPVDSKGKSSNPVVPMKVPPKMFKVQISQLMVEQGREYLKINFTSTDGAVYLIIFRYEYDPNASAVLVCSETVLEWCDLIEHVFYEMGGGKSNQQDIGGMMYGVR